MYVDPHLPRHTFGWYSSRLGLEMPIVSYGDRGHPLLLLPTAQADFLENERFYLIKSIEPWIFAGKVRVFSIDSINKYAWMSSKVPVREAARRHALYAEYIEHEVVPHIRRVMDNPRARIGISGASFGAVHAANQVFRRPDLFDTLIAMSGFYDLEPDYTEGQMDDNIYFNNPASYLSNMSDGQTLDLLRNECQINIITGQGAYEVPQCSRRLSQLLWDKGVPNNLDVWGHDVDHDWPSWRKMLPHYVGQRVNW
ncbi:MAG: alpha/beta hydrolase-fold protein [Minicystis sp.]